MQEHPATGFTLQGEQTKALDFTVLAAALGVKNVRVIDPYDLKMTRTVMKEELAKPGPSVVISNRPCVLFKRFQTGTAKPLRVDPAKCIGCKMCLGLGCPPIAWKKFDDMPEDQVRRNAKKQEGHSFIDENLCNGCTVCRQLCKVGAINQEGPAND
jgi:indolepyruvate ferredoxin oxidoreductase alpha subunit